MRAVEVESRSGIPSEASQGIEARWGAQKSETEVEAGDRGQGLRSEIKEGPTTRRY